MEFSMLEEQPRPRKTGGSHADCFPACLKGNYRLDPRVGQWTDVHVAHTSQGTPQTSQEQSQEQSLGPII
jgi:hypothetical protein